MPRLLISAGPTYEPIDAVRFIGNRSSGKLGSSLADRADELGWDVRLLLGPNAIEPSRKGVDVFRFTSCADLEAALAQHLAWADCLVMAAAVADYRPKACETDLCGKRRRVAGEMSLELESTPDLLKGCAEKARPDQLLVGFALEPAKELMESARRKLERKGIDLIVANPLETMDSDTIEAWLVGNADRGFDMVNTTEGAISKARFASWILKQLEPLVDQKLMVRASDA